MLGRLLKQDIRATGRVMVVLYAAVLVLAAVWRVMSVFTDKAVGSVLIMFFSRLIVILFFVAIAACVVMAFVLMVIRFYKNYLTDEGYLMFTLPVTTGQLIWSKLIVAVLWVLVSALVGVGAAFILSIGTDMKDLLFDVSELKALFRLFTTGQSVVTVLLVVAGVLLYAGYVYLRCYAAMAVGQSFGRNKLLYSVLFYVGFGVVEQVLSAVIASPVLRMDTLEQIAYTAKPFDYVLGLGGALDGWYLVLCVVYFVLTYVFFKKKLNLQ